MDWSQTRFAFYVIAFFTMLASLAAMLNVGTYDSDTGMFDPHPFDVRWLALQLVGVVAPAVSAVAVRLGWGK
jgi:hypothetical protein